MGRIKGAAPPPPVTPRRIKKPTTTNIGSVGGGGGTATTKAALSVIAAFDELCRNSAILSEGSAEDEFLRFVKCAEEWRRRWAMAEVECQRLQVELTNMVKEMNGKDMKIKHARIIVEDERKRRQIAEQDRDNLQRQLQTLRDILSTDAANTLNNETKEKIRLLEKSYRPLSSQSNLYSAAAANGNNNGDNLNPVIEESQESVLDASELSYDETRDEILGESRLRSGRNYKQRKSSGNFLEKSNRRSSNPRRMSRSVCLDGGTTDRVVATTTVTVINGKTHAESIIETKENKENEAALDKYEERAKRSRRSRESRRVTYNDMAEPNAPPAYEVLDSANAATATAPSAEDAWSRAHALLSPLSTGSPFNNASPFTPRNPVKRTFSNAAAAGGSIPNRAHQLVRKKLYKEEDCGPCGGKIKMAKTRFKCIDCGATAHPDCKDAIPLPCVPSITTPVGNKLGNYISDYTSGIPPMIPGILIHCIQEIEARGLTEIGLYRISGMERESQELLEKFLRNKGAPSLARYDIHSISSCLKKFLGSLKEPLIPQSLRRRFIDASENPDTTDAEAAMYQCISELPQPNRDTLAFIILHLQKVASSPDCKMGSENLARVFGPTIVGYSSNDQTCFLSETPLQKSVMLTLLGISADYWRTFVMIDQQQQQENMPNFAQPTSYLRNTPENRTSSFTPFRSAGPSERKTKKFKGFHKKSLYFQSPMLS